MKAYNIVFSVVILLIVIIFIFANCLVLFGFTEYGREYRIQAERICNAIENGYELNLDDYPLIVSVEKTDFIDDDFLEGGNSDYLIRKVGESYYRIEYKTQSQSNIKYLVLTNCALAAMAALIIAVMLYIRVNIVKRFETVKEFPYELSKGNLTVPLKENKSRFFGSFIWGLDMLREKLEQQKADELRLQKEKKTLILSVSHDIKTPLAAIKLYSNALSRGLYKDKEKQTEIAESISDRVDDIEKFISEIIKVSNEDFLSLEVNNGEFYLSELVDCIKEYYSDKLSLIKTEFIVSE